MFPFREHQGSKKTLKETGKQTQRSRVALLGFGIRDRCEPGIRTRAHLASGAFSSTSHLRLPSSGIQLPARSGPRRRRRSSHPAAIRDSDSHLQLGIAPGRVGDHHPFNNTNCKAGAITPRKRSARVSSKKPIYFTFHRGRWEKLNNLACISRRFFFTYKYNVQK